MRRVRPGSRGLFAYFAFGGARGGGADLAAALHAAPRMAGAVCGLEEDRLALVRPPRVALAQQGRLSVHVGVPGRAGLLPLEQGQTVNGGGAQVHAQGALRAVLEARGERLEVLLLAEGGRVGASGAGEGQEGDGGRLHGEEVVGWVVFAYGPMGPVLAGM